MQGLFGILLMVGFIGIIVLLAILIVKIANWNYDRKEKKFNQNCPLFKSMRDNYSEIYEKWCDSNNQINDFEKEIKSLSDELIFVPNGSKEQYYKQIEELKEKRIVCKIEENKIIKELKQMRTEIYNYLLESNYADRAENWKV